MQLYTVDILQAHVVGGDAHDFLRKSVDDERLHASSLRPSFVWRILLFRLLFTSSAVSNFVQQPSLPSTRSASSSVFRFAVAAFPAFSNTARRIRRLADGSYKCAGCAFSNNVRKHPERSKCGLQIPFKTGRVGAPRGSHPPLPPPTTSPSL
ncbi:hypothetical protein BJV82DRAFT_594718 [Fennellomyces sp. T-0311]|nr:hypothetical protein BJV82DRAFT_594718 [Fennellomyces sp. T-0311]